MSYRDYKIFAPEHYYHVFNRGVGKMDIFKEPGDLLNFLKRIKLVLGFQASSFLRVKPLPENIFSIICYCLMPNHFHFLIRQNSGLPISEFILKICTSYGKYFNRKYDRIGGLFQDQFKAALVDSDAYLFWLSAYIHNNPKTSGLVADLAEWPWSSYPDYAGLRQGELCDKEIILKQFTNPDGYRKFVDETYEKIKFGKDIKGVLLN